MVTLLNLQKPRDRTHYEHFRASHGSFYRAVEATSMTPFAPRALDRALAAVVVAAARHYETALSPPAAVRQLASHPAARDAVTAIPRRRASMAGVDDGTIERAFARTIELFDLWEDVAAEQTATGGPFTYEESGAHPERKREHTAAHEVILLRQINAIPGSDFSPAARVRRKKMATCSRGSSTAEYI